MRPIMMSMSVSACVCLSVRDDIPGTTRAIITKFLSMFAYATGSVVSGMSTTGRIAYRWEGVTVSR